MSQKVQSQLGFGTATGRANVCPECRKPLPTPDLNQLVLVCANCRAETVLAPPLLSTGQSTTQLNLRFDGSAGRIKDVETIVQSNDATKIESGSFDDDFELTLEPESERIAPASSLLGLPMASLASNPATGDINRQQPTTTYFPSSLDSESRTEQAKQSYNDSAGLYPRERHYPTLEAMQRLYRIFGYVAVLCVFPYIGLRFFYLLITTREQHLQVMAEFSEFAAPVLFGCVALTGTLFAASEGIKLAMDIQDNTLRIANGTGRSRPN